MSEPRCIDLAERFGQVHRITFDEAYDPRRRRRDQLDPWAMQLPGRFGTIYPAGGDRLGVMLDGHPQLAKRLQALPCCRLVQDGDWEKTFEFDVADFDKVAEIVRPRRRRRASPQKGNDWLDSVKFTGSRRICQFKIQKRQRMQIENMTAGSFRLLWTRPRGNAAFGCRALQVKCESGRRQGQPATDSVRRIDLSATADQAARARCQCRTLDRLRGGRGAPHRPQKFGSPPPRFEVEPWV